MSQLVNHLRETESVQPDWEQSSAPGPSCGISPCTELRAWWEGTVLYSLVYTVFSFPKSCWIFREGLSLVHSRTQTQVVTSALRTRDEVLLGLSCLACLCSISSQGLPVSSSVPLFIRLCLDRPRSFRAYWTGRLQVGTLL